MGKGGGGAKNIGYRRKEGSEKEKKLSDKCARREGRERWKIEREGPFG